MIMSMLMNISAIVFAALFFFLLFTNSLILLSFFIKKKEQEYQPSVSIIIPVYNEEKRIRNCIEAITSSDYPKSKYEIIVVDDGSTDNTTQIAKKTAQVKIYSKTKLDKQELSFRNKRTTSGNVQECVSFAIIKTKHQGKVNALNKGMKCAKHEYILTIDADTAIEKDCITNIVKPFINTNIGAVAGIIKAQNKAKIIEIFQNIDFYYANLMRIAFTKIFNQGIWLNGAVTCYRKSAIQSAGWLRKDTETEDLDISLQLYQQGYRTIIAPYAIASTQMPATVRELMMQRTRWCTGNLQCLAKHRKLFSIKESPSIIYTFINQKWWVFFSVVFFPLTITQIIYWLPTNSGIIEVLLYFFRWFSIAGPAYVIYKLPLWGFSAYNFFGVMSGIMTTVFIIVAIKYFKDSVLRNITGIFFYFPYTILLNISNVLGIFKYKLYKPAFFIR